jgi:hypothetical protein
MNPATGPHYQTCEISDLSEIRSFRQNAIAAYSRIGRPIEPKLMEDRWDEVSIHLGLLCGNQLVGAVRFSPPIRGRLPVHDYVPVPANDFLQYAGESNEIVEVSRAIIHPKHCNIIGPIVFAKSIYAHILSHPTHILVDVLLNSAKTRAEGHFLRLGFIDTGIRYWDGRYGSVSAIMIGTRQTIVANITQYLSH